MSNEYNPIRSVDGKAIPCPAAFQWDEADVSLSESGRTEAGVMEKMRMGAEVSLQLTWEKVSDTDCAAILQAFAPEYVTIIYKDAKAGTYITKEFYVGDRSAVLFNSKIGKWESISFHLVSRGLI